LRGSRALITGASRGIDSRWLTRLPPRGPRSGWSPARRRARGGGCRLARHGVPVATAAADVTDIVALDRAVSDIATALGGLDHLVANAGGTVGANLAGFGSRRFFAATFALNAGHAAELIRAGLQHLRAAGNGSVVIISSITGMRPAPRTNYAVAKAGRDPPRRDRPPPSWPPGGIRVNAVSPGSILFPGGFLGRRSARTTQRRSLNSGRPSSAGAARPRRGGR